MFYTVRPRHRDEHARDDVADHDPGDGGMGIWYYFGFLLFLVNALIILQFMFDLDTILELLFGDRVGDGGGRGDRGRVSTSTLKQTTLKQCAC